MSHILSPLTKAPSLSVIKGNIHFLLNIFFFLWISTFVTAQDATLQVDGTSAICIGETTSLEVIIGASINPYTVIYSDGNSNFTLSNYTSDADLESPTYGGDPILVSPVVTTTYSLISVTDQFNTSLPISTTTVTIQVNPLPSAISTTINSGNPVCYNTPFLIEASAIEGDSYELWNETNTAKIGDIPFSASITANTNYTVRAISATGCITTENLSVNLETIAPSLSGEGNKILNPGTDICTQSIPDYRSTVTVSDNCSSNGNIIMTQSPIAGTILSDHGTVQPIVITATDESGNENTYNFNVTLQDNQVPEITCLGNQTLAGNASCEYQNNGTSWNPLATDNCAIDELTYTLSGATNGSGTDLDGVVFSQGVTTVTWIATDPAGLTASCSFDVTITDDTDPTVSCLGNQTVNTNTDVCSYTHAGNSWNASVSDNCGIPTIVYELSGATEGTVPSTLDGTTFNVGITNVQAVVTDASGNTDTCDFSIGVNDQEAPQITGLPSDTVIDTNVDSCVGTVNWIAPIANDNCNVQSLVQTSSPTADLSNGDDFPLGITTITYTATDDTGNTATESFTITVLDNQNPEISCPSDISQNATNDVCGAVVTYMPPIGTDNCSGVSTIQISGLASGATFPVGITTNTFEVTDASGNTATCSFTITILDNEAPSVVNIPADITVGNDTDNCGAIVTWVAPTSSDNCSDSTITQTSGNSNGTFFPIGATTITYTATDASGNSTNTSFTINVEDRQQPVIEACPTNITKPSDAGQCGTMVSWTEPSVTDNCTNPATIVWTKSHTPGSVFPVGTTTVTYIATDEATNNSLVCSFDVLVEDIEKPVIGDCPSNITTTVDSGECDAMVSWTEPTAVDNCTDEMTLVWTKSHIPGSTFPVGTTTVSYIATDASGNTSATCRFDVVVADNEAPQAACIAPTIFLDATGVATLTSADVDGGSSDNCTLSANLIFTLSKSTFNCSDLGTNPITVTVIDESGNESVCNTSVTVVDAIAPTLNSTTGTVDSDINTDIGSCNYSVQGSELDPVGMDNCSGVLLSYTVTGATSLSGTGSLAGETLLQGANTITWTASDGANTSTPLVFTKTVVDNQAPTVTAVSNQFKNTTSGICGYEVIGTEFDPVFTDNCSITTTSYSINGAAAVTASTLDGEIIPPGINTIVWTASDGLNTRSTSFRATVNDSENPVISVIADITENISTGCDIEVNWSEPTASDNCVGVSLVQTDGLTSGSTFPVGTTTITYEATDASGNSATMSFDVIINDLTPPVLTCVSGSSELSPFLRNADTGDCFYTVSGSEFDPVTSDGCAYTDATNSFDGSTTLDGKELPVGTHTITWTATDENDNISTCTIYVTVADLQNPSFEAPTGEFNRTTDPTHCYYTIVDASFDLKNLQDNCSVLDPTYSITNNGTVVFTGIASLSGLQLPKDENNNYVIEWTLSDSNGNTVVAPTFSIAVSDNQAPTFECNGNETRTISDGSCDYTVTGTEFDPQLLADNCDVEGDLIISYVLDGVAGGTTTSLANEVLDVGVHTIVWTVADLIGNNASCEFNITIVDEVAPTIAPVGNQTKNAPTNSCAYTVVGTEFDPPSVSDNCPSVTLINNQSGSSTLDGFDFPVGITVVVWTATDAGGNSATIQYQVEVLDVTAPDFELINSSAALVSITKSTSSEDCFYEAVGSEFDPQAIMDNCTMDNYTILNDYNNYRSLAFATFPVGTTTVNWSITDNFGNETTKTLEVTVEDDVKPIIDCPASTLNRVNDNGQAYYTIRNNELMPDVIDNCGIASYTYTISGATSGAGSSISGIQLNEGLNTITWTATDMATPANTEMCVITVDVVSSLFPSLSCIGNQSRDTDSGICTYSVQGSEFDALASTPGAILTNNYNNASSLAGAVFPEGTTFVTWTASQEIDGQTYTDVCSYYVFVNDSELPTITAPVDVTTNTNAHCRATGISLGTPITGDNCGVLSIWNNADTSFNIGTQTITWYVEDVHGNIASDTQQVTVNDDDPPTFECRSSITRRVDEGQNFYTVFDTEFKPFGISDCSGFTAINDFNGTSNLAGEQFSEGTTTVTWTLTDGVGNSSTCVITITITDSSDTSPAISCRANQRRDTDVGLCTYTIQGTEMDVSSTSPGSTLTYTLSGDTTGSGTSTLNGIVVNKGATTVTWSADNGSNSNSYCTYNIYIIDNEDPMVNWPSDIAVNVDADACAATIIDLGTPTATDNCDSPLEISYTKSKSDSTFNLGETLVYWTARDQRGNFVYHTQSVTVVDNIAPTISCPSTTYYREYTNSGVDFYYVNGDEFTPVVSDNCEITSYTNSRTGNGFLNGEKLTVGSHTFTWTASDGTHTSTCDVTVVVIDSFEPQLTCPNQIEQLTAATSCSFEIPDGITDYDATFASVSGSNRTLTHDFAGAPSDTSLAGASIPVGTTTITWTATQTINGVDYSNSCSFDFTVTDETLPVLDSPFEDITVNVDPGTCTSTFTLTPPTGTDNCTASGDLTITNNAPAVFILGTTIVRWELEDEAGNVLLHEQNVTVYDDEAPVIANCPVTNVTAVAEGASCQIAVSWPSLIVSDECSGMDSFTSTHSPGSLFDIGTTTVTYTAIDNNGNTSTCSFDVVVSDTAPTISCLPDQSRNTDSGSCSYTVFGNELDPTGFDDNCASPVLTWSFTDPDTSLLVTGMNTLSGVTIPRGPENGTDTGKVEITWTIEDSNAQTSTCSYILTINDDEAPIIVVPGNQFRNTDTNQNYYTVSSTEFDYISASDNCGIVTKIVNEFGVGTLVGEQLQLGENSITWEATDDNGNIGTAIFIVTIEDNEIPRLETAPSNINVNTSSGCSETVNYIPPTFVDNVTDSADLAITVSPVDAIPGYDFPIGDTEVTYTVTDEAGNTLTYKFTVTVNDTIAPVVNCPAGDSGNQFNRNTDIGKAFYTAQPSEFDPISFSDNCQVTLENDYNNKTSLNGEKFPIGSTTVTWVATDENNNQTSCEIEVVITDVEDPIINNCPDTGVSQSAETGQCYYLVVGSEYDPFDFDDNAGLSKLTYSLDGGVEVGTNLNTTLSGVQIPVGTASNPITTVLWRLYDSSDNISATCTTEFTISDDEDPNFNTIATQIRNTDLGLNTYTAKSPTDDLWNIPVTDNCGIQNITYQIDGGAKTGMGLSTTIIGEAFSIGTHTIVWEATDVNGNTSTGIYQVVVEDEEDPTVVCNPITVQLDATGNYTLTATNIDDIAFGTTDPSGIQDMTVSPSTFDCTKIGNNTVTLAVTDNNGNVASCQTIINVEDVIPPVAVCRSIALNLDALGIATITANDIDNGSTDSCGIASLSVSKTTFDCNDLGANTVTLTVTDINGNSATCDATVTISDTNAPVAVCKNITVSLDEFGNATIVGLDVDNGSFDNCQDALTYAVSPNTFDCSDVGENSVNLTVTDGNGNSDSCTAIVTVEDNTAPTAICQNITVNLNSSGIAAITANDIDNGSLDSCGVNTLTIDKTTFDCTNLGSDPMTNTVTLTVADVNGNTASCTALVTVVDDVPPVVTCTSDKIENTDNAICGYQHIGAAWDATASDGCVAINTLTYELSGATVVAANPSNTTLDGQIFNSGVTTVTWTAVDGSGVSSQCSSTVTINDDKLPNVVCQDIFIQLDAAGNASIISADIDNGSTDNCGIQEMSLSKMNFTCADFGPNTVTLTVTDTSGNIETCDATVTVEDTIVPVVLCTPITVQLNASGNYSLSNLDIDDIATGSSDNCPNFLATVTPNTFDCTNVGANSVTLTITDIAGNTDTCTTTVTVEDNVDPIAVCQDITVQLDATGNASITGSDIDGGSNDACGIVSLSASQTNFTCTDLGTNNVTLIVTDANGNQDTCVAVVTVEDNVAPVFNYCPTNFSTSTDVGLCTYTQNGSSLNPNVVDNCNGVLSVMYNLTGVTSGTGTDLNGVAFNQGVTSVTWTATDSEGNSDTCIFSVTINDTSPPIATIQDITVELGRDGTIQIVPSDIDNGSTDNCGIVTYEISGDGGTTFDPSVTYDCSNLAPTFNQARLRVTDAAGLSSIAFATVTIEDNQAPALDDISDRNVVADTDVCTYTHLDNLWNPTDNCDVSPTITYTLAGATTAITGVNTSLNGQIFETGTTTVTWTVSDNASPANTDTISFNVVVTDDQAPTISCPVNIMQDIENVGDSSVTVSGIPAPIYDDNCSVTRLTYELSGATTLAPQVSGINELSSSTFNLGTTTVEYVAYDAQGNSETCTFLVTVNALPENTVVVTPTTLQTSESSGTATFDVVLPFEPSGDVVFDIASDNEQEGTVSLSSITFDESNWDIPQTITVTGVDDDVQDGDTDYTIILTTDTSLTDELSGYYNVNPSDISVTNLDNDMAGVSVSASNGATTEDGGTATFTLVLDTEPVANVTITLATDDTSELEMLSESTVTFTAANWDIPQTVTVTGKDDDIVDGPVTYTIVTSDASSSDPNYDALSVGNVSIVNEDNDTAGFIVTPTALTTTEAGGTATFTIQLTSKPATDSEDFVVVVDMASSNVAEGIIDESEFTFTADNWNTPQTVTVTGIDDVVVDGTIGYTILNTVNTTLTTDINYDGLDPEDVSVNNSDDDAATVSINSITETEGDTGTVDFVFTITHSGAEVIGGYGVTFFTSNGEAKAPSDFIGNGGVINFTTGAIGETQTVTISVNGDTAVEIDETFNVVLNSIIAPGKDISIDPAGKTGVGTIQDNDNATISISDASIQEGNMGTTILEFIVELDREVEDGLTLDYSTSNGTALVSDSDYDASSSTLTFEGTANEQEIIQIIVNGDDTVELDESFTVNLSNLNPVSAPGSAIVLAVATATGTIINDDNAEVSITGFNVDESAGTAIFTISSDKPIQDEVTLNFVTADVSAGAGTDYTAIGTTLLTFGGLNAQSQNINVTIIDNAIAEPEETLNGILSSLVANGQNVSIGTASATGTITDNDAATIAIDDVSVGEGAGTATFTVTLTGNVQDDFTLDYATSDNSALAGSDYTSIGTTTLTFGGANANIRTFTVDITENTIAEPTESFFVDLGGLTTNGQTGISISDARGEGTITDNDALVLDIAGLSVTETEGMQTENFTVTSNIAAEEDIVLGFTTSHVGTTEGTDYTTQTGQSYTLPAGDTSLDIPVAILGDLIAEAQETFTGTISLTDVNGQDVSIGTASATGTITDNDAATIAIDDVSVGEGTGTATFTVTLTGNVQDDFTLDYATSDNSALAGSDYTSIGTTTLTFGGANANIRTFTVDITENTIAEPTESFFVDLGGLTTNGQTGISISDARGEGTITDNDALVLDIAGLSVTETEGMQTENFTVTSNIAAEEDIVLGFTTSHVGTTEGADYTTQTGQSYTLPAGDTSLDIPVAILGDLIAEAQETFTGTISLTGVNGQDVSIGTASATGTITDNDAATITIVGFDVDEGIGSADFTISTNNAIEDEITIDFTTSDVSTTSVSDYTRVVRTLSFGATNVNTQTISVAIIDDNLVEASENLEGILSNLLSNNQNVTFDGLASDLIAIGTINDNDTSLISISTSAQASEPNTNGRFTISSNNPMAVPTSISYVVGGDAIPNSDYVELSGVVTIPAGDLFMDIEVPILDDSTIELSEDVIITLTGIISGDLDTSLDAANNESTATISDDDSTLLSLTSLGSASESGQDSRFQVSLSEVASTATVINYTISGTATSNDYEALRGNVTIPAGELSAPIEIVIIDDNILEGDETIDISLTGLVSGDADILIDGANGSAIMTIVDDDSSIASIEASTQAIEASVNGQFTVSLSNPVSTPTILTYSIMGTATPDDDYVALSGSITIPSGDTIGSIDVIVIDDVLGEGSENIVLTITNVDSGVNIGTTNEAVVTIEDDDSSTVNIQSLGDASEPTVDTGFEITLNAPLLIPATIDFTVSGTATAGVDYQAISGSVTIPANTLSVIIPVIVIDDDMVEYGGETVAITFDAAEDVLVFGAQTEAEITINDDEVPTPGIELIKTGELNGDLEVGALITYTFTVMNTGNLPLDIIQIEDPLLTSEVIPVSGILAPGEQVAISSDYEISQADIDEGKVTNTAYVFATDTVLGTTVDDNSDNGIVEDGQDNPTIVELSQLERIALIKTATFNDENLDGVSQIGETITYQFEVTNTGNVTLTNVRIEDALPGIVLTGEPIILEPGASDNITFRATYAITVDDIAKRSVTNQAMAFGTTQSGKIVQDLSDPTDIAGNMPTEITLSGCELKVFNAISPGTDRENEAFLVEGLECYPINKVEIYNRWGKIVFEREAYNNKDNVFRGISEVKGTVNQSRELPDGTYFYVIKYVDFDGSSKSKAGYLHINRR
ncbi:HYR domain-containing protein [Maribacter sp. 2307UL18-2]|uniref:HYR domain-containing protein n=1 Tax=Maribacter sp. 2307UL18-2 TaxID=3386274 RepID=UPI0039BD0A63